MRVRIELRDTNDCTHRHGLGWPWPNWAVIGWEQFYPAPPGLGTVNLPVVSCADWVHRMSHLHKHTDGHGHSDGREMREVVSQQGIPHTCIQANVSPIRPRPMHAWPCPSKNKKRELQNGEWTIIIIAVERTGRGIVTSTQSPCSHFAKHTSRTAHPSSHHRICGTRLERRRAVWTHSPPL